MKQETHDFPFQLDADLYEYLIGTEATRAVESLVRSTKSPSFLKFVEQATREAIAEIAEAGNTLTPTDFITAATAGMKKAVTYHV